MKRDFRPLPGLLLLAALTAGKIRAMSIRVDREFEKRAITSLYTLNDQDLREQEEAAAEQ